MPELRIRNVSFSYATSATPVLRSINLTIPEGEFVLLAGPSGCGKSTLALALAGLIPSRIAGRFQGSIYLGDRNVSTMDIHEVSQNIGMVFQSPEEQLIHLDVESEIAFGPENLALPRAEIEQRVQTSLHYTGTEKLRAEEIFTLSGGQKQRIAISATLAMLPRVLVLDEPTSDLDPLGTSEVLSALRALNKQYGMTILLIEHKIDQIVPRVDRVIVMDAGKIVVDAPPRKAFEDLPRWYAMGVSVPQVVQLARALPNVFQETTPLSVDEAYDALHGTNYAQALLQRNEILRKKDASPSVLSTSSSLAPPPILSWEAVSLSYGSKQVLKDITVNVLPQEWLAIIGPNGSGKTSLASLAIGLLPATTGTLRYKGRRIEARHIFRQAESMSYLFQAADTMLFGATVEQEFLFGARQRRKHQKDQKEMSVSLAQLLEMVDLTVYRKTNPFHLSFGQRKRLAIGALLSRQPDLLILDEPTTGQDEGHAHAFLQFLQQLRERNRLTYVMITHDMQAVARYANRVVVLKDGCISLDGHPEIVFAHVEELAESNILPPPIAQLHARLCEGQSVRVSLQVADFLQSLQPVEVNP